MLIILYLMPVFLQLALLPFWLFLENCGTLSFITTIVNAVVTPVYLSTINAKIKNDSFAKIFLKILISFVICIMCSFITYCNWGISTGYLFAPDSLTILVVKSEIIIAAVVLIIGLGITYFIKSK